MIQNVKKPKRVLGPARVILSRVTVVVSHPLDAPPSSPANAPSYLPPWIDE